MANNWGPGAPSILGLQWLPVVATSQPVASGQASLVTRLRSTAVETIGSARMAIRSNPLTTDRVFTLLDVIPAGSEVASALQIVEYPPILDETIGNWTTDGGGVTNLFARIDDAVQYPPVGTDYIRQIVGGNSAYRCSVDSSGFPATARVLRVSIRAVIGMVTPGGTAFVELNLFHQPTSTPYSAPGSIIFTNGLTPNYVVTIDCGEINPVTNLPWIPADIQSFDSGDWHLRVAGAGTGANGPTVTAMSLRVSYVDPDNRVAVGTWRRPSGALTKIITTDALVTLPAGTANWAKPGSGDFSFLWRVARDRLVGAGAPSANDVAWMSAIQNLGNVGNPPGLTFPPVPGMTSDVLTTDEHGLVTAAYVADAGVGVGRIVLRTTAPADSNDSQAYYVDYADTDTIKDLTAAQSVGQRITPGATNNYLGVRMIVQPPAATDCTLTIRVFGVASGLQVGGTFTMSADDVRALPTVGSGSMRLVEGFLSSAAALVNATQYEIRATVDAGAWKALCPYTGSGNGSSSFAAPGGTGTGDCLRLASTSFADHEALLAVLMQPTAPTGFRARVVAQPQGNDGCYCTVSQLDTVVLSWTATALAGAFVRYEIERDSDDGRGYLPVHQVIVESVNHWTDYEAPYGRPVKYRLRVINSAAAFSDWVTDTFVVCAPPGCAAVFTSNADPTLQVVYDRDPSIPFTFPDHERDTILALLGVDYQVAFIEPENRGVTKRYRLTINFGREPRDSQGRIIGQEAMWTALRALTRSPNIPYVCVKDETGNVMYAHVELGNGLQEMPGWRYHIDATCTPVTGSPAVGETP